MAEILELVQALDADLPRLLIDSVTDYAIFVLDPNGNVISWNPGAERIKGWTPREIIGQHHSVFYTPEDIAARKPWRMLEQVVVDGRLADQGWRVRKDGSAFWADVVIASLRDPEGNLVGFAKVTRDMTDSKRAADAERTLAALEERERIARELHDSVIRTLFGIGLGLQAGAVETTDGQLRTRLEAAISELDKAIKEVRDHVFNEAESRRAPTPTESRTSPSAAQRGTKDRRGRPAGRRTRRGSRPN